MSPPVSPGNGTSRNQVARTTKQLVGNSGLQTPVMDLDMLTHRTRLWSLLYPLKAGENSDFKSGLGVLDRLKHNQARYWMWGLQDRPSGVMGKKEWTPNAFVQQHFPLPWSCSTHSNERQGPVTRGVTNSLAACTSLPSPHPATSLPGALRRKRRRVDIYEHVREIKEKQVAGVLESH